MRNINPVSALALTSLLFVGCAAPQQQDTTAEARSGIEATISDWMTAISQDDAAGVAACYTQDAELLPPNEGIVRGREAVQAWFQGGIDAGLDVRLEIQELEVYGDTGYEVGKATVMGPDGQTIDDSKYIVIWKKVGDAWRMHRDIFNSNLPLPAPAEEAEM
jgi:uncharacterized protein (TIGR02246 family)